MVIKASLWPSWYQTSCCKKAGLGTPSQGFTWLWFIRSSNSGMRQNAEFTGAAEEFGRRCDEAARRLALQHHDAPRVWLQPLSWQQTTSCTVFLISMQPLMFFLPPNRDLEARGCLVARPQKRPVLEASFKPPCPSASS